MKGYQKLVKPVSDSQLGTTRSDFEVATTSFGVQQNDVIFCRKVTTRQPKPSLVLHQTKRQSNMFVAGLRSSSSRGSRCHRSGNGSESGSCKMSYIRMLGTIKFPLQMELSDIKMRQKQREPQSKLPIEDDVSGSCWEMDRSLREKGTLMSALKASFRCFRIV